MLFIDISANSWTLEWVIRDHLLNFMKHSFLEGLYIAVRTQGVPIYKVFLLLILFVYSFFFYFILFFCFAFIMPLIIVTYKGSFTDSWVRISVLVSKGRYFSLSTISVVLSLFQMFTLTTFIPTYALVSQWSSPIEQWS